MIETKAQAQLVAKVEASEFTQSWLALETGVRQPSVSAWVRGHSRPDPHLRPALERLIGIPADDWMTDEEYAIAYGHARDAVTEEANTGTHG
jgi:transcriptional regulator with XRE-family HTH domain